MKMKSMKFLVVIAGIASLSGNAFAQREAASRDERRAQRRQENANLSPEQRRQNFQARMQDRMKSMTPEQRQRMQERMQQWQQNGGQGGQGGDQGGWQGQGQDAQGAATAKADQMRAALIAAGILDSQIQDDIIAFVLQQETVRASLLQVAQTAAQALIKPTIQQVEANGGNVQAPALVETAVNPNGQPAVVPVDVEVANVEVERTLGAYEQALNTEKERYAADLKTLDEKVAYSTTPRIKSFLALIGVLNFESYALGGPEVIFASPSTGRRGRGQRQRQAQNNMGENGQQNNQGQGEQGQQANPEQDVQPAQPTFE